MTDELRQKIDDIFFLPEHVQDQILDLIAKECTKARIDSLETLKLLLPYYSDKQDLANTFATIQEQIAELTKERK